MCSCLTTGCKHRSAQGSIYWASNQDCPQPGIIIGWSPGMGISHPVLDSPGTQGCPPIHISVRSQLIRSCSSPIPEIHLTRSFTKPQPWSLVFHSRPLPSSRQPVWRSFSFLPSRFCFLDLTSVCTDIFASDPSTLLALDSDFRLPGVILLKSAPLSSPPPRLSLWNSLTLSHAVGMSYKMCRLGFFPIVDMHLLHNCGGPATSW